MATLNLNSANIIQNNTAVNGGGGYVATGGTVQGTNSTYTNNTATGNGGAVYLEIPAAGQTAPMYTSTGTTYTSNTAPNGDGGAIFDATAPPYSFPPVAPTNYPNLVIDPSDAFQGNSASVAYTGPASSLTGTPSISEPAAISIGNVVLNNYDINYRANPITVTKTNNTTGPVTPGTAFNYTITITNNGNQATANPFTISDPLPANVTLTGTPSSPAGVVTNTGTASNLNLSIAGNIPPGGTTTVTLPVTIASTAPSGALGQNTATVNPGNSNPTATGTDANPPVVVVPSLTVTKTNDTTGPIPPGTSFNYTITINNTGSAATANPFTITDTLPTYVTLTGTPTSSVGSVTNSGTNTALNLSIATSIPPGGSATITLPVTAATNAPTGTLSPNTIIVDPGSGEPTVPGTELTPPVIALPVLTVTKNNNASALIPPGTSFNYRIVIQNTGGLATANPYTITDTLPQYVTLTGTPTASDGSVVTNTGTTTALSLSTAGSIPAGGTVTITLPVTVGAAAPNGQLAANIATVNPGGGGQPSTGVEPNPPTIADPLLTVTKTNNVTAPIPPGTSFNYTMIITNIGNLATANPITITDTLPQYVTLTGTPTAIDGSVVTNSGTNTNLDLSVATSLPANGIITITLPVTVATTAPAGPLSPNTAIADPGLGGGKGTGVEPTPPVVALSELVVTKTNDTTGPITPGTSFDYTIRISNDGQIDTGNPITITDTLPQYVTLTGTPTSSAGAVTNSGSNVALDLSIATSILAGGNITVTLPVTAADTAPAGQLAPNVAVVDPNDGGTPETGTELVPPTIIAPQPMPDDDPIVEVPVLVASKVASDPILMPGDSFYYTITITNTGTNSTSNPFTITDTLPRYISLIGVPASSAGTITNSGDKVNLVLSAEFNIAPGQTASIILPVRLSENARAGQLHKNVGVINPGNGGDDVTVTEVNPPIVKHRPHRPHPPCPPHPPMPPTPPRPNPCCGCDCGRTCCKPTPKPCCNTPRPCEKTKTTCQKSQPSNNCPRTFSNCSCTNLPVCNWFW